MTSLDLAFLVSAVHDLDGLTDAALEHVLEVLRLFALEVKDELIRREREGALADGCEG